MKIRTDAQLQTQDQINELLQRRRSSATPLAGSTTSQLSLLDGSETVNVETSLSIRDALDPTKMEAERRAKLEKLKAQIADGSYKPEGRITSTAFFAGLIEQQTLFAGLADALAAEDKLGESEF